jgi:hypothetical protein
LNSNYHPIYDVQNNSNLILILLLIKTSAYQQAYTSLYSLDELSYLTYRFDSFKNLSTKMNSLFKVFAAIFVAAQNVEASAEGAAAGEHKFNSNNTDGRKY